MKFFSASLSFAFLFQSLLEMDKATEKDEQTTEQPLSKADSDEEDGQQIKLVIVGDMGVGKSALLRRFADDSFSVILFNFFFGAILPFTLNVVMLWSIG